MVVVTAVRIPAAARVLAWATPKLVVEEVEPAGVPASVYRLGRDRPRPALVFLNGVTARGRHHPDVRRLAEALARAGFLVAVPDPPGLADGRLAGETLDSTVSAIRAVADRPDALGGRVCLLGVSIGATLALLAAEDEELARRVTVVAGIAPYPDFLNAARLATTGHALEEGKLVRFRPPGFLGLVTARSLVGALPPSASRRALLDELERVPDDADDPLACFRSPDREPEDAAARAVVAFLGNRDPERFDELYGGLPAELRAGIAQLSPVERAAALRAPVEIAVARNDKYLPPAEVQALAEAATGTTVRLTVTSTLSHADLRLRWQEVRDFLAFYGWVVRTIMAAGRP